MRPLPIKPGDKVYCINNERYLNKGSYYTVYSTNGFHVIILDECNNLRYFRIKSLKHFSYRNRRRLEGMKSFNKFFKTNQQIRKLKLLQLANE